MQAIHVFQYPYWLINILKVLISFRENLSVNGHVTDFKLEIN